MIYSIEKIKEKAQEAKTTKNFRENFSNYYLASIRLNCLDEINNLLEKPRYWTPEKIFKIVSNCYFYKEFRVNYPRAYRAAISLELLGEIKLTLKNTPKKYKWNKKDIIGKAKKYHIKSHFIKENSGMYKAAQRMGILNEVFSHMDKVGNRYQRMLYSFEFKDKSVYVGLTYDYKTRFKHHLRNHKILKIKTKNIDYKIVRFNKKIHKDLVGEKEKELIEKYRRKGWTILNKAPAGALGGRPRKYTDSEIISILGKFSSKVELKEKNKEIYYRARRSKNSKVKRAYHKLDNYFNYWSFDKAKKEAKKYSRRVDFARGSSGAYNYALKNNILDKITIHMKKLEK